MNRMCRVANAAMIPMAVLCVAVVAGCAHEAPVTSRRLPTLFTVGACTHFSQGKGTLSRNIDSIRQAVIGSIRDEVSWATIEREKDKLVMPDQFNTYVRQTVRSGVSVLLILDYSNRFYDDGDRPRSPEAIEGFCRYAEFVVRHFGKHVRLYEIWNEWDIGIGLPEPYDKGGSAEDYVKLLKAVYPRIKAIDPGAMVLAGACTSGAVKKGWLEEIVKLGALDCSDAISIHSYNYSEPFPQRSPEACSAWMAGVQEMLRKHHGGKDVPFYVTEMGWPTHVTKHGTDPELSASYLGRLYLLARMSPSFKGLWWYDFQDDGWKPEDNEDNFGLVRPDLTPKPAYYVLKDVSPTVTFGQLIDRLSTSDESLWILRFKVGSEDTWALWSADDRDRQVILRTESPGTPMLIQQAGQGTYVAQWGQRDWSAGRTELVRDRLSIVVGHRPVLIGQDLSGVSVVGVVARPRKAADTPVATQ